MRRHKSAFPPLRSSVSLKRCRKKSSYGIRGSIVSAALRAAGGLAAALARCSMAAARASRTMCQCPEIDRSTCANATVFAPCLCSVPCSIAFSHKKRAL